MAKITGQRKWSWTWNPEGGASDVVDGAQWVEAVQ